MRLVPGKLYRVKKNLWGSFEGDSLSQSFEVPQGVLMMFIESRIPFSNRWKAYCFLLGEKKIIFLKRNSKNLADCFQSTDDWCV